MRLLVVTERLQDPPTNGAEAFANALLAQLRAEHAITVVCRPCTEGAKPLAGFPRIELDDAQLQTGAGMTDALRKHIDGAAYDLLYNLGNLYFGARVSAFILVTAPRLPLVNHFQALLAEYSRVEGLDAQLLQQAAASQAMCARLGSLNIFSSLSEYRAALEHKLPVAHLPAAVVPNGLHIDSLASIKPDEAALAKTGLDFTPDAEGKPPLIVLTSGRFADFAKGGDIAYRAFARLHAANPHTRLVSVSDGPRFFTVLGDLPAGTAARIEWCSRPAYLSLLAACDVFLMPSRYEAFGLAAAEAMLLGKPVVANAIGGLQDVVLHEQTGLLAEPESGSHGLGDALIRLAGERTLRERLGAAGAAHARYEFAIPRVARLIGHALAQGRQRAAATANVTAAGIRLT